LNRLKPVHYTDLRKGSPLGDWLSISFTDRTDFPTTGLEVDFRSLEFTKWSGIDYISGGHSNKSLFLEHQFNKDTPLSDSEKRFTDTYMSGGIVHPHILNLSYLFNDREVEEWTNNRYCGLYFDEKEIYFRLHSYDLPTLKSSTVIAPGNILSDPNSDNPFTTEQNTDPIWIEIDGEFYRVVKFTETLPLSVIRQRIDNSVETEVIGRPTVVRYRIVSDKDLSGTPSSSINKRQCIIDQDGNLINPETVLQPHIIPGLNDADLNMINIAGDWFRLLQGNSPGTARIYSDHVFNVEIGNRLTITSRNITKEILLKMIGDTPMTFNITRFRFTEIRDFDQMITDNDFSRYEYESVNIPDNNTEEPKMYLPEVRSKGTPVPFDDFRINGRTELVPVSSDYTANLETFEVNEKQLGILWNRNPVLLRFGYQNSISYADRPYLLNTSNVHGTWNRSVNTDLVTPRRTERNLDHFYTFLPGTLSYVHHSLHIDKSPNDPYLRLDVGLLTGAGTYSSPLNQLTFTHSYDYHNELATGNSIFLNGTFTRARQRSSFFNKGGNGIPNTTVFKGIRFRAYDSIGNSYKDESFSTEINTTSVLDDYSFMSILSCNDKRINNDGVIEDTYFTGNWISASSSGGITEFLLATSSMTGSFVMGLNNTGTGYNVLELEYPPGNFTVTEVNTVNIPGGWGFTALIDGPPLSGPALYRNKMQWSPINVLTTGTEYHPGDFVLYEWRTFQVISATTINDPLFNPMNTNPVMTPFPGNTPFPPGFLYNGWGLYNWTQYLIHPFYDDNLEQSNYYDENESPLFDGAQGSNWVYIYGEYYEYNNAGTVTFWSPVTSYSPGDTVIYENKMYQATVGNTGTNPGTHPEIWVKLPFNGSISKWIVVQLWSPVAYPIDTLVVKDDVLYWSDVNTPTEEQIPGVSDVWKMVYTFKPLSDFTYPKMGELFIPIIKIGKDFCINTYNPYRILSEKVIPILNLDSGITIYVDHRHDTVTMNIFVNDNTLFSKGHHPDRTRNIDRDPLYMSHNSRFTANNVIRQLNDLDSLYGFTEYTTYVITDKDGSISVHNINSGIRTLPLLLLADEPEEFDNSGIGPLIRPFNSPVLSSVRELINGQIESLEQIDDYNGNTLAVEFVTNNMDTSIDNGQMRRFSGQYSPVTYNIELFGSPYLTTVPTGELKYYGKGWRFDENLCLFGMMRQRMSQKYSKRTNILQLSNTPSENSIYPMLDETGLSLSDHFIFMSYWDSGYHLITKKATRVSRTPRTDILKETIIQNRPQ
jgi:hypothetical protein